MRIIDLQKLIELRKTFTLRMASVAGIVIGVPLFLFSLGGGFLGALLFGVLFGGGIFGLVYGLRSLQDKSVIRRTEKLGALEGDFVDVMFNREYGVLEFFDNSVVFHNCTAGGNEAKRIDIPLTEEVVIVAGPIEDRKREKLIYKDTKRGYVMIKDPKNLRVHQFVFIDIDGALEHVSQVVNTINKYQG